jgi:hypothetical protein
VPEYRSVGLLDFLEEATQGSSQLFESLSQLTLEDSEIGEKSLSVLFENFRVELLTILDLFVLLQLLRELLDEDAACKVRYLRGATFC